MSPAAERLLNLASRRIRYIGRRTRVRFKRRFPNKGDAAVVGNPETSMSIDMSADSRTLLVAFGGMSGDLGMPAFEFYRATSGIPVKRVFVRDLGQAWFHRGLPEHGPTLHDATLALQGLIEEYPIDRLVCAGNSAGGYAAIVFGTQLGADAVLSFAPQTVLDLDELARMGDRRWDTLLAPLVAADAIDLDWADLGTAVSRFQQTQQPLRDAHTRYHLYFDDTLEVDRLHAERLAGVRGARLYRFGVGEHVLVRRLRASGALERLLRSALLVPQASPHAAPWDSLSNGDADDRGAIPSDRTPPD